VELADALGSGPSECKLVRVRFPPSAIPNPNNLFAYSMENRNGHIEVLSQSVVEKIAAGEIIERPMSVLKELIENAIDSGARKIDMKIEDGGFSLIQVADDGKGMNPEDLRKSILPHATSKIRIADDLYSLSTMGFRGEALASIVAVSRCTIVSADSESGLAYKLQCDGCETPVLVPAARSRGTTVTVQDLFFTMPARKKFMKTRKAERMALIRLIEQLAAPFPEIQMTAAFEGKPIIEFPPNETIPMRISRIAGTQFSKDLIHCWGKREGMEADVYVSSPQSGQRRPRFQDLYVNRRKVENDQVLFAIREALSHFITPELKPSFFCFMTISPSRIDVNVHPAKTKIKFEDERMLFGFIAETVRRAVSDLQVGPRDIHTQSSFSREPDESPRQVAAPSSPSAYHENSGVGEKHGAWGRTRYPEEKGEELRPPFVSAIPQEFKVVAPGDENTIQLTIEGKDESWGLIPCYQIHAMFILAPIKNGILLIDQHAAHERILFEQALHDSERGSSDSQQLLFPIVIELSTSEKEAAMGGKSFFSAVGFDINDFGGNAVSVSAIPAFMKDSQVDAALRDMVRYLLDDKNEGFLTETKKRLAAAFACGAAIKAGHKLSQEEMNALLNALFGTENPYICPHGRPTIVRLSLDELGRRFLR
jgi:DNA mismatch repair protein MutL